LENVLYKPYISNVNPIETDVPELFVKENYKAIFFEKYIDWQKEDERRFLSVNGPDLLSINNCIEFICLGNKFEKRELREPL